MNPTSQRDAIGRLRSLNVSAFLYWYRYYQSLIGLLLGRHITTASFFWALRFRPVALLRRTGCGMYLVCPNAQLIAFGRKEKFK